MYEMMAGAPPFEGDTEQDLFNAISYEDVTYPPNLHPDAVDLVSKVSIIRVVCVSIVQRAYVGCFLLADLCIMQLIFCDMLCISFLFNRNLYALLTLFPPVSSDRKQSLPPSKRRHVTYAMSHCNFCHLQSNCSAHLITFHPDNSSS